MHRSVPLIRREERNGELCYHRLLPLHAVAVVDADESISLATSVLFDAMRRSVRQAGQAILESLKTDTINCPDIKPCLLLPEPLGHFITLYSPANVPLADTESQRRQLHETWRLSLDRPQFRPTNRFTFSVLSPTHLIRNIHQYVPKSPVNGRVSLVPGRYDYHHYMQDGFNDKGWGCAYRSFQSIWSWLALQGYTVEPVPSHRNIQEALVRCGDRPSSFVGTSQWIGSLELSFVLNELLQMESRILSVNSGSELASKARELAAHFETEGTPVMIGGGVLAHSIIGVDFNADSGDVRYLVLDPHYTGDENIKTIVDKGWVGWKPVSFWADNAFYNLLLPTRPRCF
jgi:hypothetical protein